nr:MAG TPA: hypothetical protein [Caudoviricetes sp.]
MVNRSYITCPGQVLPIRLMFQLITSNMVLV